MQAALGAVATRPAALAALAGKRRVGVADRGVPLVVKLVVRQVPLADVRPAVVVAPVGQWIRLPKLVRGVPAELLSVRAGRRLVAANAGDPAVEVEQRAVERRDLRDREIEVGIRLPELVLDRSAFEHLDLDAVALLDVPPVL